MSNIKLSDAHQRVLQRADNILKNTPSSVEKITNLSFDTVQNPSSYIKHDLNGYYLAENAPHYMSSKIPIRTKGVTNVNKVAPKVIVTPVIKSITPTGRFNTSLTQSIPISHSMNIPTTIDNTTTTPSNNIVPVNNITTQQKNQYLSNIIPVTTPRLTTTIPTTTTTGSTLNSSLTLQSNGATYMKLNLASSIFDSSFNAKTIANAIVTKNANNSIDLSIIFSNPTGTLHYPPNPLLS